VMIKADAVAIADALNTSVVAWVVTVGVADGSGPTYVCAAMAPPQYQVTG
jgi:hypothetical protein